MVEEAKREQKSVLWSARVNEEGEDGREWEQRCLKVHVFAAGIVGP
jgi:hypothetical protein